MQLEQKPKWKDRLKEQWNENPVIVLGAVGAACAGAASLVNALSNAMGRRTWAKEVNRRVQRQQYENYR